jgi:hypothetical protein
MDGGYTAKLSRDTYLKKVENKIKSSINRYMEYTIKDYCEYYHHKDFSLSSDTIQEYMVRRIAEKVKRIGTLKSSDISETKVAYMIKKMAEDVDCSDKIDNYIRINILRDMGYTTILYNSEDCEIHSDLEIDIGDITIENTPPLKYGCSCEIKDHTDELH